MYSLERRLAIDIGSGTTKLMVADVDIKRQCVVQVVLTREVPVLYGISSKQSSDGCLTEAIQQEGLKTLKEMLAAADTLKPKCITAVATEVFRRAPNGREFARRISEEVGICVSVIDQSQEAQLGLFTAAALAPIPLKELIMWDCGGSSFQLVSCGPSGIDGELQMLLGPLGDSVATALLVEIQGCHLKDKHTPNPATHEECKELIKRLKQCMPVVPEWLHGSQGVVGIGGRNSLFFLLADMLLSGAVVSEGATSTADEDGAPIAASITAASVRPALDAVVNKPDEVLHQQWCWRPNSDPPSMVAPKLCLISASMEHFGIESIIWRRTVGSCPGILVSDPKQS
eukprot:gnl/MRDRNA2_/MRDRNA2_105272_c0_seq1.p1 gnl/MRDRNA2_/MRDRNA2_105272_c0~~gnl/MRDRNA2_/MRDRNA2_105272_c0_seq1.p1  ORF type:complete len:386 (+),score=79.14 gnl/MRDRNA2_/MRDRNA2_105272_c0_seq1:132-1160(+)